MAGRLVDRPLEAHIAPAAVAAAQQPLAHADRIHVEQDGFLVLVQHLGTDRYLEHHILALAAVHLAALAEMAGLGLEMLLVTIVDQGVQPLDRLDPDIAAAAAVAAVGPAVLDIFLPPERDRPAAPVARADVDLALVEEFHRLVR